MKAEEKIRTTCCIVGGGPAGMMAGFLLARANVEVVVLEKHADFLRDFRGDTIHPSTLQLMYELGLLEEFLSLPHQRVSQLTGRVGLEMVTIADFSQLKLQCPYIALMPQWDFLNFLARHAKNFPRFQLRMQTEVTELVKENGRIIGVVARMPQGVLRVESTLVLGTDGRHSITRQCANMEVQHTGTGIDVLWMRLTKKQGDLQQTFGSLQAGKMMVMLDRGQYWQCAYIIAKGGAKTLCAAPITVLQQDVIECAPFLADRVQELQNWDQIKLLTVSIDHLKRWWQKGLLCIGDAAHAMSPVGGVGINLAIQDAVAAANVLAKPLKNKALTEDHLAQIQRRRQWPMRIIQCLQILIQNRIILNVLNATNPIKIPFAIKLFRYFPILQRLLAYIIGVGFRTEHIRPDDSS